MQRIGYDFPSECCFCYGADLLLRQFDIMRGEQGKNFSYRAIQPIYVIVLMEKSPKVFHQMPDRAYQIDRWAALFKATTWEELKMLATTNQYIEAAVSTIRQLTQEEKIRQRCEAREDYYRRTAGREELLRKTFLFHHNTCLILYTTAFYLTFRIAFSRLAIALSCSAIMRTSSS